MEDIADPQGGVQEYRSPPPMAKEEYERWCHARMEALLAEAARSRLIDSFTRIVTRQLAEVVVDTGGTDSWSILRELCAHIRHIEDMRVAMVQALGAAQEGRLH